MATLFNTKISQTYEGLLKTIDNAAITATLKELTDGSGNQSGLYLNTAGDFKVSAILEWGSLKDTGTGVTITRFVTSTDGLENFDNNTSLPTSAAVKLYVDTKFSQTDTLTEVLGFGNTTSGKDIAVSAGDDITLTTTSKIIMGTSGAAGNFQIYNDGSNSYINENGAGDLRISTNGAQVAIQNGLTENMGRFIPNSSVILYYDNVNKFQTTAAGAQVTGDLVVTGTITGSGGSFLPLAGGTMTGNIVLNDNVKSIYGTAGDGLEVYHDGSNSFIRDTGTGNLKIQTNTLQLQRSDGSQNFIQGLPGAEVTLFYNGASKFETTNTGVSVTGSLSTTANLSVGANATFVDNGKALFGASSDLQIFHDGSNSYIQDAGIGNLRIWGSTEVQIQDWGTGNYMAKFVAGAQVELYYNAIKRLETLTDGAKVTGNLEVTGTITGAGGSFLPLIGGTMTGNTLHGDNIKSLYGTGNDLEIYHDGTHGVVNNTVGNVYLSSLGAVILRTNTNETSLAATSNGAVDIYYDNAIKLATTNTGISVTGNGVYTGNVFVNDNQYFSAGDGADFRLLHSSSDNSSYIQNYTGNLYIDQRAVTESIFFRVSDANSLDVTALTISRNGDLTTGRDVTIAGDLTVNGTTTTVNSQTLAVVDPLIQLAKDNTANSLDIGLYGDYNDGTGRFLGLFSDASDSNKFKLFKGTTVEPTTTVNIGGAGYVAADLQVAGFEAALVTSSGGVIADTYFVSSDNAAVLATTGAGTVFLRPNGEGVGTGAMSVGSSGNVSIAGKLDVNGTGSSAVGGDFTINGGDLNIGNSSTVNSVLNMLGTNDSFIEKDTGNDLYLVNNNNEKDLKFRIRDVNGANIVALTLDGSAGGNATFAANVSLLDEKKLIIGTGGDLQLSHQSGNTYIQNFVGNLEFQQNANAQDVTFKNDDGTGGTTTYFQLDGGEVETSFFKTTRHLDNVQARFGTSGDLRIYHDSNNSYITDVGTGDLRVLSNRVWIKTSTDEAMARFTENGAVELYYNNSNKFQTTSTGVNISTDDNTSVTLEVGAGTQATDKEGIISLFRANSSSARDLVGQLKTDIPVTGVRGTMLTSYQAMGFKTDSASVGHFAWINGTDEEMRLTSTGRLGIGIETPGTLHGVGYGTTKLHIDGRTDRGQMIIEGDAFAGIVLSDNGATANERVFATSVDGGKYQIKPLNDNGTSSASVGAILLHGGFFGLGTETPAQLLQVQGDGSPNKGIGFKQAGAQEHRIFPSANVQTNVIGSSTPIWFFGQSDAAGALTGTAALDLRKTAASFSGAITSTGLTVNGGAASRPTFVHQSGYGGIQIAGSSTGSSASLIFSNNYQNTVSPEYSILMDGASDSLVFISGDPADVATQERMRITSGGLVNITNSADYSLRFSNQSAYNSNINNGIVFNGKYTLAGNVTDMASVRGGKDNNTDGDFGGKLTFHTRINGNVDTERMRIDSSGNIGIGAAPTGKLDVDGAILVGSASADGNIQMSQTGMSTQQSGSIEFTQGYSGTASSGDSIVFTYEALSWKSWRLEYTISSTDGMTAGQAGGYNNGGAGHSKYSNVDTLGTTVGVTNSGQHVIVTFTFTNLGTHPAIFFKYSQGGGDGKPVGSRAKIVFNS